MKRSKLSRALPIVAAPVVLVVLAWFAGPALAVWLPACPLYEFTGLYCPGCGLTRAAHHLVHGHLRAAVAMNPLIVVLAILGCYVFVCELLDALGRPVEYPKFIYRWHWAFWGAIVAFGIARNVHSYPFSLLAPH